MLSEDSRRLKPGDIVLRFLVECDSSMNLLVINVTAESIICKSSWEFDRSTGAESMRIWAGCQGVTGSWIEPEQEKQSVG